MMTAPEQQEEVQIYLTPEARDGDWLDFTFNIEPESMGRVDSHTRLMQAMDFATKILPAAVAVAQQMMMIGMPFNLKTYIIKMAKDAGIDWFDQVFMDPEFQQKMAQIMMMGPKPEDSQGQVAGGGAGGPNPGIGDNPLAAIMQNGGLGGMAASFPSQDTIANQQAQAGAVGAQRQLA